MANSAEKKLGAKRPTMRDVSALAGVSVMTVSRAIATPERVSPDNLRKVRAAISMTGYVPDRNAGALSSQRSGIVALLLPTLANSNFADLSEGISEILLPQGLQPLIGYAGHSAIKEEELVRTMMERRPDAFVLVGIMHSRNTIQMLHAAGIPVIETWEDTLTPIDSCIGFSNARAGELAAEHLIGLGHRKLAAIGGDMHGALQDLRGEQRLLGFQRAVRRMGLGDPHIIRLANVPIRHGHGADCMTRLLEVSPDVEAVFAISDTLGFGAMMECQRRQITVPDRISIIGFGDFDMSAQAVPGLTTISVAPRNMGRRIGSYILSRLDRSTPAELAVHEMTEPHVVLRDSTRAAACPS